MPDIRENIALSDYSTFKIGGPAKYFCIAKDENETKEALDFAISKRLRVFVIGRGSNLLISDDGFDGLIIKTEIGGMSISWAGEKAEARLGAGIPLAKLLLNFQNENVAGLEWAAGIPATLGGAIANNAGAKGSDIGKMVKEVSVLKMQLSPEGYLTDYAQKTLSHDECGFSYRKSIFKDLKRFVILGAVLSLQKGSGEKIRQEIAENMEARKNKQPLEYPNIGSIFKNPVLTEKQQNDIARKCPDLLQIIKDGSVPAGWLIEKAGMKGRKVGGMMISEKHANFIVNTGNGRAEDAVILIGLIKEKIRIVFGIQLREEIEYVGF
jgi:UDP-N-acetylmuramate dehydrogenase